MRILMRFTRAAERKKDKKSQIIYKIFPAVKVAFKALEIQAVFKYLLQVDVTVHFVPIQTCWIWFRKFT